MMLIQLESVMEFMHKEKLDYCIQADRDGMSVDIYVKYEITAQDLSFIYNQWRGFFDMAMYEDNEELSHIVGKHIREFIISHYFDKREREAMRRNAKKCRYIEEC